MSYIKEVQARLEQAKKQRGQEHRLNVLGRSREDRIESFTDKQWNAVKTKQKSSFAKGKSAAYSSIWSHNSVKI
jgi:hypothetical protein|tara:strand:- start:387 stop:608 length:222 start_codon:yes stop_codon:yes gene_type:complete